MSRLTTRTDHWLSSLQRDAFGDAEDRFQQLARAFLGNVQHEIRTPLNIILGHSSIVEEHLTERGDYSMSDSFSAIAQASRQLLDLLQRTLDLAELEAGMLEARPELLTVARVIQPLGDEARRLAEKKRLSWSWKMEEPTARVLFDRRFLVGAVSSLLDNAIKFTSEGAISVRLYRDVARVLRLEIRDTGPGIARWFFAALAQPFRRQELGYARQHSGLGVGLALARRFLETHRAALSVASKEGEGSIFTICFRENPDFTGCAQGAPLSANRGSSSLGR